MNKAISDPSVPAIKKGMPVQYRKPEKPAIQKLFVRVPDLVVWSIDWTCCN